MMTCQLVPPSSWYWTTFQCDEALCATYHPFASRGLFRNQPALKTSSKLTRTSLEKTRQEFGFELSRGTRTSSGRFRVRLEPVVAMKEPKKRNKKDSHGDTSNEDLINPDLFVSVPQAHVPQVRTPGSFFVSMRPAILAPVCSPPVTPRAAKKPKNSTRTLTSVVQELSEGVQELKVHLLKMSRRIKKLRHRVKMFSAKPALLHGGGQDTWDTS